MNTRNLTAAICTLGCKVNQYESSRMVETLKRAGFRMVRSSEPADLYIINTCTVTSTADSKSRQAVHRALRLNPQAKVVLAGCIADYSPDEAAQISGVSLVVSSDEETRLAEILYEIGLCTETPAARFDENTGSVDSRTRALLKIQDGCDQFCSYCVIPHVRGEIRSRPAEEIVVEASKLAKSGYKEIVLTGIRLGSFGTDRGKRELAAVAAKIAEVDGIERIRLSSIEPTDVDDDLIALITESRKLCAHLHLPLQSGDDGILRAMNRPYTAEQYLALVEKIRERVPDIAFTTDALVGFPGENENAFQNTCRMAERVGYSRMHVFKFSPRRGTAAADLPDQKDSATKERRSRELIQLAQELGRNFRRKFSGSSLRVLVEGKERGGLLSGLTDNYIRVSFPGSAELRGRIVQVQITGLTEDGALGKLA